MDRYHKENYRFEMTKLGEYSLASDSLPALPIHCIVSHTKFPQVLIGIALKFRKGEVLLVTNVFWIYMWIEGSHPFAPSTIITVTDL